MATLKQIADILNDEIMPNLFGDDTTIAEDLTNLVDVGTKLASMTADQIKDINNKFALGVVKTWFDTRKYVGSDNLGLLVDSQEYAGAMQRVKGKLFEASEDAMLTLDNATTDYLDGKYYPMDSEVKIYEKSTIWRIVYSVSTPMFKTYFTNAQDLQRYVALIEQKVGDSIRVRTNALEKRLLNKLIVNTYADGRVLHLITMYNTEFSLSSGDDGYITKANAKLHPEFWHWVAETVERLRTKLTEISTKYNDSSIEVFTPESDIKVTLLKEFAVHNKYANIYTFNKDVVEMNGYNTVEYWQNSSNELLPNMGVTAQIVQDNGSSEDTTLNDIVGCIYDKYACQITTSFGTPFVSTQYVGSVDFHTNFVHIANKYFIDESNNAIVLALD